MFSSDTVATKSVLRVRDPTVGFSGGFGRMSGVANLEESFSHPPGFSNFVDNKDFSEGPFNNYSFPNEIQKTLDIGRSLGYNMDECFEQVKEIVKGHVHEKVVS